MMFSHALDQHVASHEVVKALNLILHPARRPRAGLQHHDRADRRLEPGEPVRLVRRGVCSLWGPVHGGATVAVLEMLEEIHRGGMTIDQALARARGQVRAASA